MLENLKMCKLKRLGKKMFYCWLTSQMGKLSIAGSPMACFFLGIFRYTLKYSALTPMPRSFDAKYDRLLNGKRACSYPSMTSDLFVFSVHYAHSLFINPRPLFSISKMELFSRRFPISGTYFFSTAFFTHCILCDFCSSVLPKSR